MLKWINFFDDSGASVISGFFSAVCGHPYDYLLQIKAGVQKQYASGDKNAYRYIPHYVSQVLRSSQFYSGFLNTFRASAMFCVVRISKPYELWDALQLSIDNIIGFQLRWWIYESVAQP